MKHTISLLALLLCTSGYAAYATPAGHPLYNEAFALKRPSLTAAAEVASTDAAVEAMIAGAATVPAGEVVVPTDAELDTLIAAAVAEAKAKADTKDLAAGTLGSMSFKERLILYALDALITAGVLVIAVASQGLLALVVLISESLLAAGYSAASVELTALILTLLTAAAAVAKAATEITG